MIIISADNKYKQIFDALVLVLVGYSCISTIYTVAFEEESENLGLIIFNWVVEAFFYIDIILNFIHEKRLALNVIIKDFKSITLVYLKSWFFIDFISVFPFQLLLEQGMTTKLLRLFRMPRMIKLLDKDRIKNLIWG